jgi:hypothetical protein
MSARMAAVVTRAAVCGGNAETVSKTPLGENDEMHCSLHEHPRQRT